MEFIGLLWTEVIMRPMMNSLALLYDVLFNNFGLSIIFFTVAVRLVLIPLTIRQTRQMRAMSALQPKVKALQEKYGKDRSQRAKLSQETMKLYREAGVSPVGCLGPLVVQLPIFIGLYRAIFRTVPPTPEGLANLNGLLYSWNPARAQVPFESGFLGMDLVGLVSSQPVPVNLLLPVLVGGSLWLTQKMTGSQSPDPRQQQTQQLMLWMMPIMFGFFTFQFPTGLAIYILFSNLIGIVIQYFVNGRQNPFKSPAPVPQPAVAAVSDGDAGNASSQTKEIRNDGDSSVHRKNRRRSDRSRSRNTQSKSRRSRNRRR